ncbi:hypothetical protein LTR78_007410 [Recurvomyces mirabilis]|uniref:catalase n=1 Tax=Recurvomyces mirabilis TaxID=574656 RepID=A0AAE1BYJ7_9PEZI|nr:hypothetical protein LTR78_007410 [Recurvomyces mirabilis]KAK5155003.1 catalase 1 [Recurvomyces mirabilis]
MASSTISTGLEKVQETLNGSSEGKKGADVAEDMKNVHDVNARITTDHADWLKIATENKICAMLPRNNAARDKIQSFDHERIPERVVHARGAGAFGTTRYTHAGILTETSAITLMHTDHIRVGNNIPVVFIQDAIEFPDVIHAGKPEPHNEVS